MQWRSAGAVAGAGGSQGEFRISGHAVSDDVEPAQLLLFRDAEPDDAVDDSEDDYGGGESINDGGGGADQLRAQMNGISVETIWDHGRPQAGGDAAQQPGNCVHRAHVTGVVDVEGFRDPTRGEWDLR